MTRSLYKGLQCSKLREEVEQSYSECNYEVEEETIDMIDGLSKILVPEVKPKRCEFNDCGWCYYKGDESNDNNGQCNKPESCEVNDE